MKAKTLKMSIIAATLAGLTSAVVWADYKEHWQKANSLLKQNDRKAAIIELRNALQEKPDSIEARVMLGELYYADGNLGAAEKELDKARSLGGDRALWIKPLGNTYIAMYAPQKVLEVVTEYAKDSNALKADVLALRGLAMMQMGRIEESEKLVQEANSLNPQQVEALFGLAQIARMRNDLAKAESLVNEALQRGPDFVNSYVLSAELFLNKGQVDDAIRQINKAVDRAPNDTRVRLARAEIFITQNRVKDAWQDINLVLNAIPKHPTGLYLKGKALLAENKPVDASSALNEALAVVPNYVEAQLLLGYIKNQQRDFQQAARALEPVLAQRPGLLPAIKLLASTRLGLKEADTALSLINDALTSAPNDVQLLALKANALVMQKKYDEAEKIMEQAIALAPDAGHLRASLALLQLQEGNTASAINQLETASSSNKGIDSSDMMLVSAYLSQKQNDKANELAKKLYTDNPKNALVANMYGVAKMANNEYKEARSLIEEAQRLDPNFLNATLNLVRLDVLDKQFDSAHKRLDAELVKNPKAGVLAAQKASVYDMQKQSEKAFEWQKKSWEMDRSDVGLGTAYIRRLVIKGNAFEAVSVGQQLVGTNGNNPDAHQALAFAQIANKSMAQGIQSYQKVLDLSPGKTEAYLALADAFHTNGQTDESYRTLEKLHKVNPSYWQAMNALGRMDFVSKRYDASMKWAKQLQKSQPEQVAGYHLEADIVYSQGKHKDAVALYEKAYKKMPSVMLAGQWSNAILMAGDKAGSDKPLLDWMKANPQSDDGKFALASHYLKTTRPDPALDLFKQLEAKHSDNPIVLNNLTWMYAEKKDAANTQKYLSKMQAIKPTQPELLDTMGFAALQLGNAKQALEFLTKAIEAAPEFAEARYHAAQAHKMLGNNAAAKEVLKPAIESAKAFSSRTDAEKMYKSL